eukprot:5476076-Prymnesium_polylepis.1
MERAEPREEEDLEQRLEHIDQPRGPALEQERRVGRVRLCSKDVLEDGRRLGLPSWNGAVRGGHGTHDMARRAIVVAVGAERVERGTNGLEPRRRVLLPYCRPLQYGGGREEAGEREQIGGPVDHGQAQQQTVQLVCAGRAGRPRSAMAG